MTTIYISIGNSDDNLTQAAWSRFVDRVDGLVDFAVSEGNGQVHGRWFSASDSAWQNACWCVELVDEAVLPLRRGLRGAAGDFGQNCIAWAIASTEFLTPDPS